MAYSLQNFIFPDPTLSAPESLYFRSDVHCSWDSTTGIHISKGRHLSFDTYFNSLSIEKWKKYCSLIDNIKIKIRGTGEFHFQIFQGSAGKTQLLHEQTQTLAGEVILPVFQWQTLSTGLIWLEVRALSESHLDELSFETDSPPLQEVRLGIVITHFNRRQYVLPAIKRITEQLLSNPIYKEKVQLFVIDNSQDLTTKEVLPGILVPNKNFGGAGGFTRGLLSLMAEKTFSHCLFMDDDASCEIESIKRTITINEYSNKNRLAIAGSLIRENTPYELFEKGAQFKNSCIPLFKGLDLRQRNSLILSETENFSNKPEYGAWWFFCFKISDVNSLPFPFFVRGDDVLFSLMNSFSILTTNGIACWGEDFSFKHGPMTAYLDTRSHLIISLYARHRTRIRLWLTTLRFFLLSLFSYNYASAKAILLAMRHFNEGSNFWIENMDMSEIRQKISRLTPSEKMQPIDISKIPHVSKKRTSESRIKFFLRFFVGHGFLLPNFLLIDQTILNEKDFHACLTNTFRYKRILTWSSEKKIGYISELNRSEFFKCTTDFIKQSFGLIFKYSKLNREYKVKVPYLTSAKFWKTIYKEDITLSIQQKGSL